MTEAWQEPERHSWAKTLLLHLAPGVPFTLAFILAARLVSHAGGSVYLAGILCIPLLAICEAGVLIAECKRLRWSWRSLTAPRGTQRVSILDVLLSVAAIYAVAQAAGALVSPSRAVLLRIMARWLPPWAVFDGTIQGIPRSALWLGLFLSGLVAPVIEELYFRAYLLPRIPAAGRWAPAVNAVLHAVYHFYTPWNTLVFFAGFLPLAYYVRLRGNVLPTILTHMLFNSVGVIIALAGWQMPVGW